jgi:uncharacterized repeat protein (TIGR03843 family)
MPQDRVTPEDRVGAVTPEDGTTADVTPEDGTTADVTPEDGTTADVTPDDQGVTNAAAISSDDALRLLTDGDIDIEGRLVDASNTTLRAFVTVDGVTARCVYKPVRGERPLWDFPHGTLAAREVAAFLVSAATGWDVVPPTVLRDGPLGHGACQLWVDEEPQAEPVLGFVPAADLPQGWLTVAAARDSSGAPYLLAHANHAVLARLALFDVVVNNADRKGGHVLHAPGGRLYAVDHGVCFNVEEKLRTVLWGWVGEPLPAGDRETLIELADQLGGALGGSLRDLLSDGEVEATRARLARLLSDGVFPEPGRDWPAIPWPPI